jgi:hypothetical protein
MGDKLDQPGNHKSAAQLLDDQVFVLVFIIYLPLLSSPK